MNRIFAMIAIALLLGACAQNQSNKANSYETSAEESTAVSRARIHTELSIAYYGAGQYNVAMEEVGIALSADDKYLPAINQLGLIHLALGQVDEAQKVMRRAIRLDPDDPSINNNYGMLLCSMGEAAEAMRYFDKALSDPLYRTPEFAYVNAGVCMKKQGNYLQAEQFLRRALALSPDLPQALYHMADLQFINAEYESAEGFITRHLQTVVPGPDALWLAARIEYKLGNMVAVESYGAQLNRRFPAAEQTSAFNLGRF
jgi:type IV pilus assembly protein PilF